MSEQQIGERPRSPEEMALAYRALQEDVERSPWGRHARQLLMVAPFAMLIHEGGRIEPAPHSPDLQFALDQHAKYVRECALRHGFEVPE